MALIPKEIKELRDLIKLHEMDGGRKMSMEELDRAIALYSQVERREKNILSGMSLMAKFNKGRSIVEKVSAANLIGEYEAVDPGDDEKVKCPCHETLITRGECLDYSGNHPDDCGGCEIGKATKDKLLPPIE